MGLVLILKEHMKHTYEMVAINLAKYAEEKISEERAPVLANKDDLDVYTNDGWVVIGKATVTVEYLSQDEVQSQLLGALKTKLQTVRAENQKRENAILDQISKLQALTFVEAA